MFLLLLFAGFLAPHATAQNAAIVAGTVKDKITQEPLIGATVRVEGTGLGSTTDAEGRFRIAGIPPKSYALSASYLGYQAQTRYNVVLTTGNTAFLNFELESDANTLGEVTIAENRSVRIASVETPLSIQNLSVEEIKSNPGGNFDISRVVQTLPGVGGTAGSVGGFRNDLIIRGGGPSENVFYLDGVEIPVINHFATQGAAGGPTGILNVSFIEDATLASSAFHARYDNPLSSVLQFRQRDGNPERLQGNFRVSATEVALTGEGPLGKKNGKTTFLASARRSYLQFLFEALDLPIRPDYWDFQYKITHKINPKTTLTAIGVGAIDEFYFKAPKDATAENIYTLGAYPSINQWNYTQGFTLKQLIDNGFWNFTLSRNMFDNRLDQFAENYDGEQRDESKRTLRLNSQEIENKARFDFNKFVGEWRFSAGASGQYVKYNNNTFARIRPEIRDAQGQVVQAALTSEFSTAIEFFKFGLFGQVNRSLLDERLALSFGVRADGNSFAAEGANLLRTLSPRLSLRYGLAPRWNLNASVGRYFKIAPYTVLGFRDEVGALVNRDVPYTRADHYVAGLEFIPAPALRFTVEGFYKRYADYLLSARDGLSLANQGGDFGIIGNERMLAEGRGESYGVELFAQQKLTKNLFFVGAYTLFWSKFSNADGTLAASAWDNRHLVSLTLGRKFRRNWEMGLKYRLQGGAPFTPFDLDASQRNYVTLGRGVPDLTRLNSERLGSFSQLDFRIDKKWNYRRATLDVFFDIQNALLTANPAYPQFTFARLADNSDFDTTDGQSLRADGSNGKPLILANENAIPTPSIGIIVEF
jgi:hypothetical protein